MARTTTQIVELYQKLMAKARDASVTEEEAAAFAGRAAQLLAEHGLSMTDVPEQEREDHVEQDTYAHPYAGDAWLRSIALQAARLYFCEMVWTEVWTEVRARKKIWGMYEGRWIQPGETYNTYKKGFLLVGRPHNIAVCRDMIDYLFETTKRLSRHYSTARAEYLAFQRGCGNRLASRLQALRVQNESTRPSPTQQSSGLPALYRSEADLVRAFIEANMKTHKIRSAGQDLSGDHARAGREAADSVSLSPQVAGSSSGGRLLS